MEKNKFLIINELIYDMYRWQSLEDINDNFFLLLKRVIPFSYASILLKDSSHSADITLSVLTCFPKEFTEAEERYLTYEYVDDLGWNLYSHESKVIRESDIVDEAHRFDTPMYKACYKKYHIYDNLQLTICYDNTLYGVLTLFSTKEYGAYSAEDMFFLRSIGMHINAVIGHLSQNRSNSSSALSCNTENLFASYSFTPKEQDIISHLISFEENSEIADALNISANTLQKHLQNIFRKAGVSSKWEFMHKIHQLQSKV